VTCLALLILTVSSISPGPVVSLPVVHLVCSAQLDLVYTTPDIDSTRTRDSRHISPPRLQSHLRDHFTRRKEAASTVTGDWATATHWSSITRIWAFSREYNSAPTQSLNSSQNLTIGMNGHMQSIKCESLYPDEMISRSTDLTSQELADISS
jgi:hypothetical protein